MSVEQSREPEVRLSQRSSRNDTSFLLVAFAMIAGCLIGYLFRPAVDDFSDPAGDLDQAEISQQQVDDSIASALQPINDSLAELKGQVSGAGDTENGATGDEADAGEAMNTATDTGQQSVALSEDQVERISREIDSIRLMMNDRVSYIEQLIAAGDTESQANLELFVNQTREQLAQMDALKSSVDQLAYEVPLIQDTVRTMRPQYESGNNESDDAGDENSEMRSVLKKEPMAGGGMLVIQNNSTRNANVQINGTTHTLVPGRNAIPVPVAQVVLRHPETSTEWTLDDTMWEMVDGQYTINRNWNW